MCGISGVVNVDGRSVDPVLLERMSASLRHRGPDDSGFFFARVGGNGRLYGYDEDTSEACRSGAEPVSQVRDFSVGMGFRRLSILDLSFAGHQPMSTRDGRFTIVYNGEIYNFQDLRNELEGLGEVFCSRSDTEVLLRAYARWGEGCLDRLNGMWAFAVWDDREKALFAARDRFGVKPFYYLWDGKRFVFASEIKAILDCHTPEPNDVQVAAYLVHDRLNGQGRTFFKGVSELQGSHCLKLVSGKLIIRKYYQLPTQIAGVEDQEAVSLFRELLLDAVRLRMRSDVPVGYALSGGLDSSAITAAARFLTGSGSTTQKTFSTVYPGRPEDESIYIDEVVRATAFESYRVTPDARSFLKDLDRFFWHQEEPFDSLTYYAEYRLRELENSAGVKVSLDGQGADEILGGYDQQVPAYVNEVARMRGWAAAWSEANRLAMVRGYSRIASVIWSTLGIIGPHSERGMAYRRRWLRGYLAPEILRASDLGEEASSVGGRQITQSFNQRLTDDLVRLSLPHQLVRADKSSMAFSVECRFPFLDKRVVEMALSMPTDMKIRQGVSKWVLREAMKRDLPVKVYARSDKKGFPAPQRAWLQNDLKGWVESWVYSDTMKKLPWIRWKRFRRQYRSFVRHSGGGHAVWSVLSVALWSAKFFEKKKLS